VARNKINTVASHQEAVSQTLPKRVGFDSGPCSAKQAYIHPTRASEERSKNSQGKHIVTHLKVENHICWVALSSASS